MFILRCPELLVTVDHKPLIKIFSDKAIEDIKNLRLFSLKGRSLMYRFWIKHLLGKLNTALDCTSKHPTASGHTRAIEGDATWTIDSTIKASFSSAYEHDPKLRAVTWDQIVAAAATDNECQSLAEYIQKGFPEYRHELPETIHYFWSMKEALYCVEGEPIMEKKILMPKKLRGEVLESLHATHQSVNGMQAKARQQLFEPGIDASIHQTRAQCKTYNTIAASQTKEPLMPLSNSEIPFQKTVTDFFDMKGKNYIVYADHYTGWVEVALMYSGNARTACDTLWKWLCAYGVPEEISSNRGPPFDSQEYSTFRNNWGIKECTSSAYYPQSNGRTKLAVKIAKRILIDSIDSYSWLHYDSTTRALLTHRNTPIQDLGISPAMMLYGRVIKDHLPAHRDKYRIHKWWNEISHYQEKVMAKRHLRNERQYNEHSHLLQEIEVTQPVQIQNQTGPYPCWWEKTGRVVEALDNRQYHVCITE